MNDWREAWLSKAVKEGALSRHTVHLERGEFEIRRLWLRPDANRVLTPGLIDVDQLERVKATLRRFVLGRSFNVVTKECGHRATQNLADIKELKFAPPPFVEMRFKPPKLDLRLFGKFVCLDGLVLTSFGMKSLTEATSAKPLVVPDELKRCNAFFSGRQFDSSVFPPSINVSISNVNLL